MTILKHEIKSYLAPRDTVPKYMDALYDPRTDIEHFWKSVSKANKFEPTLESAVGLGLSPNLASKVTNFNYSYNYSRKLACVSS